MVRMRCLAGVVLFAGLLRLVASFAAGQEKPTSPETTLKNAGFEQSNDHWTLHVFGAKPQIDFDNHIKHEGKHSLRIHATELSDTALGQEVLLKAQQWYRLTGWVRTRALDAHGASVFGTFQIQLPGGKGILATGANHGGDTDWTEVPIVFQAPPGGLTRISIFFVGFGKGTGAAWFDDLKLEEVQPAATPLVVTREFLNQAPISPLQYGQFMEYLCDLIPGMWAEKLYDGSFEGLTPYKFVFLRDRDFREKPWYPAGAVNRAEYSLDPVNPVNGAVCQKIAVSGGAPCTAGIAQDGIFVAKDKSCLFSCFLRQEGVAGPVHVRLMHDNNACATCEFTPTADWKKYRAQLVPSATHDKVTLIIDFRGPGTLWLDNASLMPVDNVGGWRRDVVAAVKALKPGVIRFGGSALDDRNLGDFEWRDTIGDPDKRKPFRAWGGLQPTGPGLEEIVQFCGHVGAEPLICIRVTQRTPRDAADEVQYFNGSVDTPMGRLRAKNGHPEPYHIKYWQIGNEQGGRDYESRIAAFAEAMKKADPAMQILGSYPSEGVLRQAGRFIDFVCPHHYDIANLAGTEQNIIAVQALCRKAAAGRDIKIAVTEWNTTAGDAGPKRARLWTLENALSCSRYHNLLHRHADAVTIANRSNLTNSFCSGIVQTDNHRIYLTPTYYAQQLYASLAGTHALRIDSAIPPNTAPDCSATLVSLPREGEARGPRDEAVVFFAVNPGLEEIVRPLDFSAFTHAAQDVKVWTLADRRRAGEPDVANSFAEPDRITAMQSTFAAPGGQFVYHFPPLSLTVLRLKVTEVGAK